MDQKLPIILDYRLNFYQKLLEDILVGKMIFFFLCAFFIIPNTVDFFFDLVDTFGRINIFEFQAMFSVLSFGLLWVIWQKKAITGGITQFFINTLPITINTTTLVNVMTLFTANGIIWFLWLFSFVYYGVTFFRLVFLLLCFAIQYYVIFKSQSSIKLFKPLEAIANYFQKFLNPVAKVTLSSMIKTHNNSILNEIIALCLLGFCARQAWVDASDNIPQLMVFGVMFLAFLFGQIFWHTKNIREDFRFWQSLPISNFRMALFDWLVCYILFTGVFIAIFWPVLFMIGNVLYSFLAGSLAFMMLSFIYYRSSVVTSYVLGFFSMFSLGGFFLWLIIS